VVDGSVIPWLATGLTGKGQSHDGHGDFVGFPL